MSEKQVSALVGGGGGDCKRDCTSPNLNLTLNFGLTLVTRFCFDEKTNKSEPLVEWTEWNYVKFFGRGLQRR